MQTPQWLLDLLRLLGQNLVAFLGGLLVGVSKASQHIVEKWWDARQQERADRQRWHPKGRTFLITEQPGIAGQVRSTMWDIPNYSDGAPATGFRTLLTISRLIPRGFEIGPVEAVLPFRFRWKHSVLSAQIQVDNGQRGNKVTVDLLAGPTSHASVNFYVRPPLPTKMRRMNAKIRIRDQFVNWQTAKITFVREQ